jgi:CBS domain containing-hemolysin-like protein
VPNLIIFLEVVALVGFSAICSGLNIGIVSLHIPELQRRAVLGNSQARRVLPFRKNLHLTLAAILLSNVAAIAGTSLVLNNRYNGVVAEIGATLLIVIFGEVLPQAYFAHNALGFCAWLAPLLRIMTVITYPVAKPLQLLLDRLFGQEAQRLQSRRELGLVIAEHALSSDSELDDDEIEIMRGALQLSEKQVRDIMTELKDVYWLAPDTVINAHKIDEIKRHGWSRIPVISRQLTSCHGILLMKDLVDEDFDEVARTVEDLPLYPSQIVGSKTALDTLFRKFINGGTHLFPVEQGDKIVGIVTIEDLLEEIVGREIEDETDRAKRTHLKKTKLQFRRDGGGKN